MKHRGNLTRGQFEGIGRVVVEFSHLEDQIYNLFALIIREVTDEGRNRPSDVVDPGGQVSASGRKSIPIVQLPPDSYVGKFIAAKVRRIDVLNKIMLTSLPDSWEEARRAELQELLGDVRKKEEERNTLAHASWYLAPPYARVAHGKYQGRPITKTAAELKRLAHEINQLSGRVVSFYMTLLRT